MSEQDVSPFTDQVVDSIVIKDVTKCQHCGIIIESDDVNSPRFWGLYVSSRIVNGRFTDKTVFYCSECYDNGKALA
jgi:hypothetical protein